MTLTDEVTLHLGTAATAGLLRWLEANGDPAPTIVQSREIAARLRKPLEAMVEETARTAPETTIAALEERAIVLAVGVWSSVTGAPVQVVTPPPAPLRN